VTPRRHLAAVVGVSLLALAAAQAQTAPPRLAADAASPVVVGSKPFGESYLLAELFSQLLEARGFAVTRRFGLGGTEIVFPALRDGAIDVVPEYTGSGLLVILKAPPERDPIVVFDTVSREFARQHDVRWLPPLGFENTYAMSVRTEMAERLGLKTLSDFARVSGDMRAGFTADFIGLPDGLPGLRQAYGLAPKTVSALAPAVKYQALAQGAVDIIRRTTPRRWFAAHWPGSGRAPWRHWPNSAAGSTSGGCAGSTLGSKSTARTRHWWRVRRWRSSVSSPARRRLLLRRRRGRPVRWRPTCGSGVRRSAP
jgi:glycine betaine/choline ABC-type transport system substrate-binding protein